MPRGGRLEQGHRREGKRAGDHHAAIAGILADAAAQSAALNVRINLGPIGDPAFTDPLWAEIAESLEAIRAVRDDVLKFTYEKLG